MGNSDRRTMHSGAVAANERVNLDIFLGRAASNREYEPSSMP